MTRCVLMALIGLLLVPICAAHDGPPASPTARSNPTCAASELSRAQSLAAVERIINLVRSAHYGGLPRPMESAFEQVRKSLPDRIAEWKLALQINTVLSIAHDGHLALRLPPASELVCAKLPLELAWSEAGLLVRQGSAIEAGSRILSLGGVPLLGLQRKAEESIPHENIYWVRHVFARQIARSDQVLAYGIASADGGVDAVYETPDGHRRSAHLVLQSKPAVDDQAITWQISNASSTAVLRLPNLESSAKNSERVSAFFREVIAKKLAKVAIDLRGNPGGEGSVVIAVLRHLGLSTFDCYALDVRPSPELHAEQPSFDITKIAPVFQAAGLQPPKPGALTYRLPGNLVLAGIGKELGPPPKELAAGRRLYLLVDGGTFSSAALFALLVRDNALGTLVGEPIGTSTSFNGGELDIPIPNLEYFLSLSAGYLVRPKPEFGESPTLIPDIFLPVTTESLRSGRDPAVEYLLGAAPGKG